jgi:hypothetical protein
MGSLRSLNKRTFCPKVRITLQEENWVAKHLEIRLRRSIVILRRYTDTSKGAKGGYPFQGNAKLSLTGYANDPNVTEGVLRLKSKRTWKLEQDLIDTFSDWKRRIERGEPWYEVIEFPDAWIRSSGGDGIPTPRLSNLFR